MDGGLFWGHRDNRPDAYEIVRGKFGTQPVPKHLLSFLVVFPAKGCADQESYDAPRPRDSFKVMIKVLEAISENPGHTFE